MTMTWEPQDPDYVNEPAEEQTMTAFETMIWHECRRMLNNPRMRKKDLCEWATTEVTPQDEEVSLYLPDNQVWVAVPQSCDKRPK